MTRNNKILLLDAAISAVLGIAGTTTSVNAAALPFVCEGMFTMLNSHGSPLSNSSISTRGANKYQTPVVAEFIWDTTTGAGSMTMLPFDWLNQPASQPFSFHDISIQSVDSGQGGPGTLLLGNMLYDWNGTYGVAVSMVFDMTGLLGSITSGLSIGETVAGSGAVPAVDGTYIPFNGGSYINMGPSPIATTTWNTTDAPGCSYLDCMNINPSGLLPLVKDTQINDNKTYYMGGGTNVTGIGGSLVRDSAFHTKQFNLDFTSCTLFATDPAPSTVGPFNVGPDGDIAPLGNPDGQVNAADYQLALRIVLGALQSGPVELAHGDLYPQGQPDGEIDLSDFLLLKKIIFP